jgi:hypothetical protein
MNQPAADNSHAHAGFQNRREIDTLYTPLDEALAQLRERRADERLRATVNEFQRICPPAFLCHDARAFFVRHVVTPNREFELFASTTATIGLPPLCLEYTADFLSTRNAEKCRLCHPVFEVRPHHFRGLRVLNFGQSDGQRLCDLRLSSGVSLPEFHHALLHRAVPGISGSLHDFSSWFSTVCRQDHYYLHYLALFIRDGILFENFLADDPEELRFARERVIPSFTRAVELFGVRPLIVPLLPRESECDDRWRSHDGALYSHAVNLLRQRHAADS